MLKLSGFIEVDLFSKEIKSLDHPEAIRFKKLLEAVAEEYQCRLLSFDIDDGTAVFSFDSDELTSEIIKVLQNDCKGET